MIGRDHYAEIYASQLDAEAKWLAFGAVEKANSIEALLRGRGRTGTVLELGAGTGAIIAELQRRGFARRYIAVDYSPDACRHMEQNLRGVDVRRADIIAEPVRERVDVVVLSHVLEHLEEPEAMLRRIVQDMNFEWLVIECPLEDLPASRLKNLFRDRTKNLAGHVQFFTVGSFRTLVGRHVEIVAHRHYAAGQPHQVVNFVAEKDRLSPAMHMVKHLTMGVLPRLLAPIWKHLWVGNYAVLCRKH